MIGRMSVGDTDTRYQLENDSKLDCRVGQLFPWSMRPSMSVNLPQLLQMWRNCSLQCIFSRQTGIVRAGLSENPHGSPLQPELEGTNSLSDEILVEYLPSKNFWLRLRLLIQPEGRWCLGRFCVHSTHTQVSISTAGNHGF